MRRQIVLGLLALLPALAAGWRPAAAAGFEPSRPVEVVVHSGPGGGSDLFARAIAEMVQKERLLGHRLVVQNKTGGSGAVAMAYLMEKKGDTHTIGFFTSTWVVTPLTRAEAKVTLHDLTPIARLALEPSAAVVRTDSPYRSLKEFVEAAKKNPGQLRQAGGSVTSVDNLFRLLIQKATGAQWTFVSFPGGGERTAALLGGHADIMLTQPQELGEHIRAGSVRVVAALTERRLAAFPDVPTVKEQGIDIPILTQARGVLAPPGVPEEVVRYWEGLFERLLKTASWKKYLQEEGLEEAYLNSRQLARSWDEEHRLMRNVLTEAGVKVVR
ncbi:MAG TPA: tripartite tricarboxylate transporter substrate binding protein [Thermodesulfobacteriota bacterium]|nr:tripartite tricarboxylate transporter substrate binding protein [Thermodesulfobacteriota bacterium]